MTESGSPNAAAATSARPSANGSEPPRGARDLAVEGAPGAPAGGTVPRQPAHAAPRRSRAGGSRPSHRGMSTRISGAYTALIVGILALILVLIFIIQNAHAVSISFLGAHLHLSLAVALLLAAVAGAVVMAAAGAARITQLRQIMRRDRRASTAG